MVEIKSNIANPMNYGRLRKFSEIKYIVIHFTANDGDTDESNGRYFTNVLPSKASAHYFVDDDSITRSVPDNYVAYSVGGSLWSDVGKTGGGKFYQRVNNDNSISIEMCDTQRNGKYDLSVNESLLFNVFEYEATLSSSPFKSIVISSSSIALRQSMT